MRDATYATLTDDDRRLGHRLAAELLESTGGAGPLALAEHFVRGSVPDRAIAHLRAAATKALEGNDIRGAVALSERALALHPGRADKGVLHATCAEAYRWMGDYDKAAKHGLEGIDELDEGTVAWFFANGEFIAACAYRRDFEGAHPKLSRVRAARAQSRDARNAQIVCISRGCTQLLEGGYFDEADAIIRELTEEPASLLDDNARGWMNWLFAMRSLRDGDLATFARNTEACLAAFERIGEVRNTSSQRINLGYAYAELGAFDRAEELLRRVYRDCERVGIPMVCAYALQNLGNVLRAMGRLEEAREQERRAAAIGESIGDRRIEGAARAYGALMTLELGDPVTAESQCRARDPRAREEPAAGRLREVRPRALAPRARPRRRGRRPVARGAPDPRRRRRGRRDVHPPHAHRSPRSQRRPRRRARPRARSREALARPRRAHPRRRPPRELPRARPRVEKDARNRRSFAGIQSRAGSVRQIPCSPTRRRQPYYPPQQQMMQQPQYAMQPPAKKRNPALIAVGAILLVIGTLAFLVFAYNAWQYSTVEDRFSSIAGSSWVVDLVKEADMRRMMIFGPVAAVFGLGGIVLGFFGMRKR